MITRKTSSKKLGGYSALLSSAALCAFATFFGAAPSAQGSTATVKGTFRCNYQQQVLTLVNQQRAAYGRPALKMTVALTSVAMIRAGELSVYQSHDRPNGKDCFSLIPGGYKSENMAWGQTTPSGVMNTWMNSEGHRKNILDSRFTEIAVGFDPETRAWVQVFRKP